MAALPTIRLGMRLYLQTMVRKSELQGATWDEVDFENAVWTIPKERMKRSKAKKEGLLLEPFTVHDLRRTGSTLLNELGFNNDWIETCLAHEDGRSSRGVYNKAEYEVQHRHMMQEWSNIVDVWWRGRNMSLPSFHRRCRSWSLIRRFHRPRAPLRNIGILRTDDGRGPPRGEPFFDFAQIPYDASWRQREASRELAALLHLIDRAVGGGHHLAQLLSTDRPFDRCLAFRRYSSLLASNCRPIESDCRQNMEDLAPVRRATEGARIKIG